MLQTYEQAVDWINGLVSLGMKPGLKRMEALMKAFGNPERRLKVIHVAGTNGKGSTCRIIAQILQQSGYDVGTFTSPYIERFTNRIQYNSQDIPEEELLKLAQQVEPVVHDIAKSELGSPTMFEVITAIAFLYFSKVSCPYYVVLETGLGGRLDSTNIVHPVATVITNVAMDHTDILGESIQEIATEKAGIIKPGVPLICTAENPDAIEVILERAKEKQSTCYLLHKTFSVELEKSRVNEQHFHFTSPFRTLRDLKISMNGKHQVLNASAAVMTIEVLRQYDALIVEDEDLRKALYEAFWPGRLEMLRQNPPLLLDGAHNEAGAKALSETIRTTYRPYKKLHFMLGMLETKNHKAYLEHILPLVDTLIITEPDFRKKMDAGDLEAVVRSFPESKNIRIIVERDWKAALEQLTNETSNEDLAVVSGTLYLISDIRSWVLNHSHSEKGW